MENGKWDEELGRMSEIVERLRPIRCCCCESVRLPRLYNERERAEIAKSMVRGVAGQECESVLGGPICLVLTFL